MKLKNDDRLPACVQGDVQTFRLALVTLIEFGMKYCCEGLIELMTNHDGVDVADRNILKFGFYLTLEENLDYDEKIICNLF